MTEFYPLVSCVIPIYNAEKYLDQGVKSLLSQTYQNIEIILVDDRSTDNSWSICQKYAKEFPNILAFRNIDNSGGPLRGRERGIQESHGEWITFMDGDDYVEAGYIENLVKTTEGGKYDIAVTGYSRLFSNGRTEDFLWSSYSQTTEERLATFYSHFLAHDFWTDPTDTVGQNLVRASICKKADLSKYSNLVYAEDTLMALVFLVHSKNGINFVDKHDFRWRQIEGSGSHGGFSDYANKEEFFTACFDLFHDKDLYESISRKCPKISLIVPVYNTERYLASCLDSIIEQTYKNIEIIIVNDGATDGSQRIIDEYRKIDNRISAIKQKNQGLNMARAAGSKVANGEYIAFIDSDDVVHEDYIQLMYESLVLNDVDIVATGFKNFTKKDDIHTVGKRAINYSEQIIKDKKDVIRYYLGSIPSVPNVHQMTAWGKLYKAKIIKNTDWSFSNYKRHEDNLEALQWYCATENGIAVSSVQLYFYRNNPTSITGSLKSNISPEGKELNYFEFIYELYEKINGYLDDKSFSIDVLNQFAHTNRAQVQNLFLKGQLDEVSMNAATNNWGRLIDLYNYQLQLKEQRFTEQEKNLANVYNSTSWRITKPLRRIRKTLKHKKN